MAHDGDMFGEAFGDILGGQDDDLGLPDDGSGGGGDAPLDLGVGDGLDDSLDVPDGDLGMGILPGLGPGVDVTEDRTDHFNLETGQFHDPETGLFEPGGPPPEYGQSTNRYRAADGQFKSRPADHYDESLEVALDSLEPRG